MQGIFEHSLLIHLHERANTASKLGAAIVAIKSSAPRTIGRTFESDKDLEE